MRWSLAGKKSRGRIRGPDRRGRLLLTAACLRAKTGTSQKHLIKKKIKNKTLLFSHPSTYHNHHHTHAHGTYAHTDRTPTAAQPPVAVDVVLSFTNSNSNSRSRRGRWIWWCAPASQPSSHFGPRSHARSSLSVGGGVTKRLLPCPERGTGANPLSLTLCLLCPDAGDAQTPMTEHHTRDSSRRRLHATFPIT